MKNIEEFRADVYARADKLKKERAEKIKYIRKFSSVAAMLVIVLASVFAVKYLLPQGGMPIATAAYGTTDKSGKSGETSANPNATTSNIITTTTPQYTYTTTTTPQYTYTTTTTPRETATEIHTSQSGAFGTVACELYGSYSSDECELIKSNAELLSWIDKTIAKEDAASLKALAKFYNGEYFKYKNIVVCIITGTNERNTEIVTEKTAEKGINVTCTLTEKCQGATNTRLILIECEGGFETASLTVN